MSTRKTRTPKTRTLKLVAPPSIASRPYGDADQDPADDPKRREILDIIEQTSLLGSRLAKTEEPGDHGRWMFGLWESVNFGCVNDHRWPDPICRLMLETLARNLDGECLDNLLAKMRSFENTMVTCYPLYWRVSDNEPPIMQALRVRAMEGRP